ncbi:MAG TPA: SDR family NAD(P)-dependent oxidoreductase [Caulobacteraceae bacterium]
MGSLGGKVAIITGAASGIGRASVELFTAQGAKVLAADLPGTNLEYASNAIRPLAADVADDDAPSRIVGEAIDAFGRLDILFSNAGTAAAAPAAEMSDEAWDRVQQVNLRAAFRLAREAIPHLIGSGAGRIINTASVMAEFTDYGLSAYCASKAGVVGLTRTLALELGRHGITANAILPGAILTGMTARSFSDPKIADVWARKSPLKRLGAPTDVAALAAFLASDAAGFITGQAIAADGGLTLRT